MNRGRRGETLADRAARSALPSSAPVPFTAQPPAPADPPTRRPAVEGHGRHCWVHDPPDAPGTWPGLLVEWRQRGGGWHGRVAYAVVRAHGPVLVEAWLPAEQLQQG